MAVIAAAHLLAVAILQQAQDSHAALAFITAHRIVATPTQGAKKVAANGKDRGKIKATRSMYRVAAKVLLVNVKNVVLALLVKVNRAVKSVASADKTRIAAAIQHPVAPVSALASRAIVAKITATNGKHLTI